MLLYKEIGIVEKTGDGISNIIGLKDIKVGEMIEYWNGVWGMVLDLKKNSVGGVVFGNNRLVREGSTVSAKGSIMEIGVGEELLGRVVDILGNAIDAKELLVNSNVIDSR
jgi:F0F1-type ATP synthase alpha subunit